MVGSGAALDIDAACRSCRNASSPPPKTDLPHNVVLTCLVEMIFHGVGGSLFFYHGFFYGAVIGIMLEGVFDIFWLALVLGALF